MRHYNLLRAPLFHFLLVASCLCRTEAVLAAPLPDAKPEFTLRPGEIRLDGKIHSVDAERNSFVLDVSSFTLPNGKTSKLPEVKPKTILLTTQAVLHVRGDAGRKVALADLKRGSFAIAIGKDAGSGQALTAREVAVWDRVEAGQYSFASRGAVAPGDPPGGPPTSGRPELSLQLGHTSFVTSLMFSADAKTLVSGSLDGTVRVWDVLTNELLWTLRGQGRPSFMADGKTLAIFNHENTLNFWDTRTGKAVAMPQLQEVLDQQKKNGVRAITFSPDGKIMAFAIQLQIMLFDVATAQQMKTIEAPNAQITSMLFAADARTLATRSNAERVVKLWDVATGSLKHTLPFESQMGVMAFSPDGKTFAAGNDESRVTLWSVEMGAAAGILNNADNRTVRPAIRSIAFSPDGKTLAAYTGSAILSLWDLRTGEVKQTLKQNARSGVMSVAFAPRAVAGVNQLVACGGAYHITLWDAASGELKQTLRGRMAVQHTVLTRPGSKMLVSAGSGIGATFWNVQTGELTWTLLEASSAHVAFSGDGKLMVTLHYPNIKVWDASKLKLLQEIQRRNIQGTGMALSHDGSTLALGSSSENLIRLWNLATGQPTLDLKGHTQSIRATAFAPDGKTLASGSIDHTVRLWDVASGALKHTMDEGAWIYAIAFSPDSKILADSISDGTIKLRDVATGELKKSLAPFKRQSVNSLTFSPDGKLLASHTDDTACLWDVATGQLRHTLAAAEGVRSIAFASDGATVICGLGDGSIKIWDVKTGQVLATLLVLTNNYLDDLATDEWIAYTPQGYYQGSPDVARFIRWRIGSKLFPAAKFEKQFLRPDLVQKALQGTR